MERGCLLVVGKENKLLELIKGRKHSGKRDYMKKLFCIPIKDLVTTSALNVTPSARDLVPDSEVLHPGYCGEECRDLLIKNKLEDVYVICGIETPGFGYITYDIVFPQGRCEKGENSRDTAVREFMEETGIEIDPSVSTELVGALGNNKEMAIYVYKII